MLKRHEVQVLRRAGHTVAEVAELTGVSERDVKRIAQEPAVETIDDAAERRRREIGRPSIAEPFRAFVLKQLAVDPEIMTLEILRRARNDGYAGGKSALYELVKSLRPTPARPVVRFEGVAGEFSQHDFGQVDVRFIDGTRRRVRFFGSRLKYSRWVEVTLVEDERVESLLRPMVEHFAAFGGVPLLAVFDRPKTVAISWRKDGEVVEWNSTFAQVMLELGVGVELCWPRRGNQKGSVERLVKWVKGSFFKQRRFVDMDDLREQLRAWRDEVNLKTPSRATGVTPLERMTDERARLRPLKVAPDRLALRFPIVVGPTGYVLHETHLYSMHPSAIGLSGTLFLHRDHVRIIAGRFESTHDRQFEPKATSTLAEHRAASVAAVSGKRARRYYKREQILSLGPAALSFVTEIVHRRPREWTGDVDRIFALLQEHGPERTRAAIERALADAVYGAEYVAHFIGQPIQQELRW